jgi:hypothetical protein
MEQNPKAVIVAGVGAMGIALLAGLIGGVAFGTLILRAVLGGLFFAGAAVAVGLLVRRFLPELLEVFGDSARGDVGRHVDMVVDEDVDLLTPIEEPSFSDEESEAEEGAEMEAVSEEVSEDAEEGGELVEEVTEVGREEAADSTMPPRVPDVDVSSVDKLPDLDGFVDSFQDDGTVEVVDEDEGVSMPGGQDAHTIAKAIQTVMKRDE